MPTPRAMSTRKHLWSVVCTSKSSTKAEVHTSQLSDWLDVAYAAIRADAAYKTAYFLGLANESWAQARLYTISETNLTSGSFTGKTFSLQSSCQGSTMVGGTFNSTIAADGVISGFASTLFLTVSALLAEATSDPVYLDAALDSVNFILAHLCPEFLVQTQISASQNDSCAVDNTTSSFNTGLMIEGLAVLSSITNNATMQAILNRIITATISDTDWQTTDGIITQGSQEFGDKYIMGGLRAAYVRNVVSSDLRGYVHDFIGVQFNAVVDLASENGNSVYGGAWTGPPYDIFAQNNQTLATSALLSAILLDGGDPKTNTSSSAPPLSSSTGSPLPISGSRIPQPHKPQAGAIAGGIGGGVLLLAIAVALWIFFRRRAQWGPVSSPESAPITAFDSAAPASLVMRGNKRHPQAPLSAISLPTPIRPTDIPTSDLMRLVHQLSDRLRGRRWDEEEMPPEYGSES